MFEKFKKSEERYNKLLHKYENEGYEIHKIPVSVSQRTVFCCIFAIFFFALLIFVYNIFWDANFLQWIRENIFLFLAAAFFVFITHEFFHAIIYGMFCDKKYKSVKMGMYWKGLYSYTYVDEALAFKNYLLGLLLPFLLFFVTGIITVVTGNLFMFCISMFLIFVSADDFAVFLLILEFKGKKQFIVSHPC